MDSFKGEDKQETVQTTQPWDAAQGNLKDVLGQSRQLYDLGLGDLSQRSNKDMFGAAQGGIDTLMSGSGPLSNLSATAGGDFLDVTKSPLWGSMTGGIQDAVNSQFSQFGRTGSPAHAGVMTSELGKLAGQLYGNERQNQLGAANSLGGFLQSGIGATPGVYDFGNADLDNVWKNLSRYAGLSQGIGGLGGQQVSSGDSNAPSGLQQGIGSALSLAALFA